MVRLVVGTYLDGVKRLGTVAEMPQVTEPGVLSSGGNLESKSLGPQYPLWVERSP